MRLTPATLRGVSGVFMIRTQIAALAVLVLGTSCSILRPADHDTTSATRRIDGIRTGTANIAFGRRTTEDALTLNIVGSEAFVTIDGVACPTEMDSLYAPWCFAPRKEAV